MRVAKSWVGFLTAYLVAVAAAILAFQKLSEPLRDWPRWLRIALVSSIPIAVFVFHTIPTLLDQRRRKRLAEVTGELQSGYFCLAPLDDEASFSRADGKHNEIVKWLTDRGKESLLYLTGLSGSGKSSLLAAWVLPQVERAGTRVIRLRGFQDPLAVLEEELRRPGVIWQKPDPQKTDVFTLFSAAARHIRPRKLLLVFDQFEEFIILQDQERQNRLEQFFSTVLQLPNAGNFTFLLVFRSDYIGLLEKLQLPPLLQDDNWKEVPPFTERAAHDFIRKSGLQVNDRLLSDVLREAADIEQTRGLIRPITINLCGLVLARFASGLPRGFRSGGLIRGFLREAISLPEVRDVSIRLIPQLITNYVTKRPRKILELAQDAGLEPAAVRGCLRVLGRRERSIVRPLDPDQQTWEISHDFLVPLLDSIVARSRTSFWRKSRPWLPWIAVAVLAGVTVAASSWRKDPLVELMALQWTVSQKDDGLHITYFGNAPEESLDTLQRIDLPLLVRLNSLHTKAAPRPNRWVDRLNPRFNPRVPPAFAVHDISKWSGLKNLSKLDVSDSQQIEHVEPLRNLTSLTELDLSRTSVKDLEPLKNLTNLRVLDLTGAPVSNLAPLKQLQNLQILKLSGTRVTDLEPLRDLKNLYRLELSSVGFESLEPLRDLKNLFFLDLSYTTVSSLEPLKSLPALKFLILYRFGCMNCDSTIRDLRNANRELEINGP